MRISHCYVSLPEGKIFLFLSVARVWSPSTLPMACMGSQAQEEAIRIKEKWDGTCFSTVRSIEVIYIYIHTYIYSEMGRDPSQNGVHLVRDGSMKNYNLTEQHC